MKFVLAGATALALTWTGLAAAQPADAALQGLADCAAQADAAQKATCYDAAYSTLNQSVRAGEISIIRKREAQAAQRGAFGLTLPSLSILDKAAGNDGPLENVTAELERAYQDEQGRWVFLLTEGAMWRQIDNGHVSKPRKGQTVEIRKAAFGSFFLKVGDQRGVRAKRVE